MNTLSRWLGRMVHHQLAQPDVLLAVRTIALSVQYQQAGFLTDPDADTWLEWGVPVIVLTELEPVVRTTVDTMNSMLVAASIARYTMTVPRMWEIMCAPVAETAMSDTASMVAAMRASMTQEVYSLGRKMPDLVNGHPV